MLEAYVSFAGPTGQLLNYMGNCKAIEAPTITRPGVGKYTVTFLTGRCIDATKIASSVITVQCQSPSGTGTVTNVIPSPVAVFNPNAPVYVYQVTFQIETQNVVPAVLVLGPILSPVDRPIVSFYMAALNEEPAQDRIGSTPEEENSAAVGHRSVTEQQEVAREPRQSSVIGRDFSID